MPPDTPTELPKEPEKSPSMLGSKTGGPGLEAFKCPWMAIPALAAVVFSAWYYRPTGAPPAWRAVPLTTLPGMERMEVSS